jgi:hypothetical protein
MLYVFKNSNGVQIAWNSEAPRTPKDRRPTVSERLLAVIGFPRASSLG